jgi:hypothetical protein
MNNSGTQAVDIDEEFVRPAFPENRGQTRIPISGVNDAPAGDCHGQVITEPLPARESLGI